MAAICGGNILFSVFLRYIRAARSLTERSWQYSDAGRKSLIISGGIWNQTHKLQLLRKLLSLRNKLQAFAHAFLHIMEVSVYSSVGFTFSGKGNRVVLISGFHYSHLGLSHLVIPSFVSFFHQKVYSGRVVNFVQILRFNSVGMYIFITWTEFVGNI